jgi:hypothetical protein
MSILRLNLLLTLSKPAFLAGALVLLLAVAVQAQFGGNGYGGGGYGGREPDDDVPWWQQQQQPQPQSQPQPRPTQQQGGGQWPYVNQGPYNQPSPWGGQGGYPWNSNGPRPTVTITRSQPASRPTVTYQATPPPYGQPPGGEPGPTRTWTQPSAWGPPRNPFGPTSTPTGPQTIPTTTTEAPRPNVPFLTVCGGTRYVEDDVSNALIAGCFYKNKTSTVNKSEYPKQFDNSNGRFNFGDVAGPYWEFPLISSAAYIGGEFDAFRSIYSKSCILTTTRKSWS